MTETPQTPKMLEEDQKYIDGLRAKMPAQLKPQFDAQLAKLHHMAAESTIKSYLPILMARDSESITQMLIYTDVKDPKMETQKLIETYVRFASPQEAPPLAPKPTTTQTQR